VQRVASRAMDRFVEHRALLTPARIPDLVRCGLVLGEALVQLGRWGEARQVLGDVAFVADQLDTSFGGPVGAPGSMPPGWGLPVVPTAKEWMPPASGSTNCTARDPPVPARLRVRQR
jgi:hypothetical protein